MVLMIQLELLSGKTAGARWVARRFPVRIGRAPDADLQLEEHGVWDDHLQIALHAEGFTLESRPEAPVLVNGRPAARAVLRNGDALEVGAVKMKFWLADTRQRGLKIREGLVWTVLTAVCAGQIALIYWLVR